jgi:WD40 repeat protein
LKYWGIIVKILFLLLFVLIVALPTAAQEVETYEVPVNPRGYNLEVSPDGRLAAVYENSVLLGDVPDLFTIPIRLIDLETGDEIGALAGHSDFPVDFDFSPDGTRAASFHRNGDVHLWDIETQDSVQRFRLLLLYGGRIQFVEDGRTLVILVGGVNSRLLFFDTETGAITRIVGRHFVNFNDFRENYTAMPNNMDITYSAFAVSPDGATAAVATANDAIILFDIETGRDTTIRAAAEEFGQFSIRSMEFTPDGAQLVYFVRGEPGTFHVWNMNADAEEFAAEMGAHTWDYRDGVVAWADREDSTVHVANLQTGATLLELSLAGGVTPLTAVALTPDALIVGGLQSDGDEGNVLVKIALETGS